MRESTENRLFALSIILSYVLAFLFVYVNPNIDKLNPNRIAVVLAIVASLIFLWKFAEVVRLRTLIKAVIILAIVGTLVASYMLYAHYGSASTLCPPATDGQVSCDIVNKSIYSEILGIPVSVFGILGYLAILICGILINNKTVYAQKNHFIKKYQHRLEALFVIVVSMALFFTLWLNFVMFEVLKTLCLFCEFSAITIVMLLLISIMIWRRKT